MVKIGVRGRIFTELIPPLYDGGFLSLFSKKFRLKSDHRSALLRTFQSLAE
ncbi:MULTISPECIES: hypothetical protein [Sporosarcina]|uniref:Uncharacterized protein n=1 Tax=Sporosarcina contaminans TaxID=633403 RepID=A0ABW3TZ26_9BACL